jgi:hypothetical protein
MQRDFTLSGHNANLAFLRVQIDGTILHGWLLLCALSALSIVELTLPRWDQPAASSHLRGPDAIRAWLLGRGIGCRGSRLVPTSACGSPAFGQYRASDKGFRPWALIVLELSGDRIAAWNSFLDTEKLFPLFGLPFNHLPKVIRSRP